MGKKHQENNQPSDGELKVMSAIWKKWENKESSGLRYITDELNKERKDPLSLQAVDTFLRRLEKKGYVTKTNIERCSYWIPLITREEWAEYATKELCKILNIPTEIIITEIMRLIQK